MITSTGKYIIGRYLTSQTSSYASHIVIGCGAKPLATTDSFADYSAKKSLDFEMLRIPIKSKTIINEDGITKVLFTAELPTTERYGITEIGLYPSETNPIPIGSDSRNLFLATSSENWKYHTSSAISEIVTKTDSITDYNNNITATEPIFYTTSDNSLFDNTVNPTRITRYEQPRYLNNVLLIKGDTSVLQASGSNLTVTSGSHAHLSTSAIDLSKNSDNDEIRLAFSVINKNGLGSTDIPSNVKILVQFASDDGTSPTTYANFTVNLDNGTSAGQWDFTNNRYVVATKKLSDVYKSSGFSWSNVSYIKLYVSVNGGSTGSDNFFVAIDGMRLENLSSDSNVYGLTAYTVMKTSNALPIVKSNNSQGLIEFKFVMDVL